MSDTSLIFTDCVASSLAGIIEKEKPKGIFIIADSNTSPLIARPLMDNCQALDSARLITVDAGDENKNIDALASIWSRLSAEGATRHSMVVNIGGGMVTDMGGFAAATFKRGVRCVNIPTTLLGAVDAALGGKTAVNFAGLKNEIGVFANPLAVIVNARFFATLPAAELLSGYAELLKHALLEGADALAEALDFDLSNPDYDRLQQLLERSIKVKQRIVAEDPHEHGIRKALNLGHTAAHAFESLAMEKDSPVPHGHAVAWGLVVDLVLSRMLKGLDTQILHAVAAYVDTHYPSPSALCSDYDRLLQLMRHDKKNITADSINFTLLQAAGSPVIDCEVAPADITAAIDICRDLLHA